MLSDPQKRAAYDQYGHAGVDPNLGGRHGGDGFGGGFARGLRRHLRRHLRRRGGRGRRGGGQQVYRGSDLSYAMEITLEEAAQGKETQIRIPAYDTCETCSGNRRQARHDARRSARPATARARCTCGRASSASSRPARTATAAARSFPSRARPAAARAASSATRRSRSRFPAASTKACGSARAATASPGPNGGPPGDLYIEIRIKPHDIFERDGDDLHCTVPVGMTSAALGGTIEVPTLGGKAEIDLPEGTQHGKTFRLRGKGIKGVRSSYPGDLYCHVSVETPIKLTRAPAQAPEGARRIVPQGRRPALADQQDLERPRQGPVQGLTLRAHRVPGGPPRRGRGSPAWTIRR